MAVSEKKKNLIQSLISGKSPFTASSQKMLEEMDETALEELDNKFKEEEKKPETPAPVSNPATSTETTTSTTSTETVQVSASELQSLREMAARYTNQQESAKSELIKSLLANPTVAAAYNEQSLKDKSLADLSSLAKVCSVSTSQSQVADFSVIPFQTTSSVNATKNETAPGPTVSLAEKLKQKRAKAN